VSDVAISVRGLRKSYGVTEAVGGIDLDVARGEVFALLGPNGAGKTTTVEILEGHRTRSAGEVDVLGFDPGDAGHEYRQRIGIVLQETGVERYLTVGEVVEQFRGYFPDPLPLDDILELVGLTEKRDERVRRLSGGQQRRLDVAIGLAGNPELLFLDEPTTGFDPSARRAAWDMVKDLQSLGKTVFLTTHYMDEAQHLADRVAVIAGGVIVAEGPPGTIGGPSQLLTRIEFQRPTSSTLPDDLAAAFEADGRSCSVTTDQPLPLLARLIGWALEQHVDLEDLTVQRPTLEDVYLALTADAEAEAEAQANT
jgi:ABC-2 type transport system ATP-binding protein